MKHGFYWTYHMLMNSSVAEAFGKGACETPACIRSDLAPCWILGLLQIFIS